MAAGDILSADLGKAASLPQDDPVNGVFYVQIGTFNNAGGALAIANDRFGPIDAVSYRDWFSWPIRYLLAWGENY